MTFLPNKKTLRFFGLLLVIITSLIILFWSLIKAGSEKLRADIRNNALRNIPIEYIKEIGNGEKIKKIYKVPDSNVEPGNVFYYFKKIRDQLWIWLSKTPKEEAEVYLLMADKRMFETLELIENNKNDDLISKTLDNSIYNLMEAKKSLFEETKRDPDFLRIDLQINQAGLAYEDIFKSLSYKSEKINKTLNELEIWNKKNKEYIEKN